jgi:hypothetical protein
VDDLSQSFLLAQALDGFELEQRLPILRPVDVSLDADEIVETNHSGWAPADGEGLGSG